MSLVTCNLIEDKLREDIWAEGVHVKTGPEIEVRQLQAEEYQGLLANDQKLARSTK